MAAHNVDTNGSPQAIHHTLGPSHNQASPGDHTHDGGSSVTLDPLFNGVTISGGRDATNTAINSVIAALVAQGAVDSTVVATQPDTNDTGWVNLTLVAPFTAGVTPQIRRMGKRVIFRGSIRIPATGYTAATLATAFTIPGGYIPPITDLYPCSSNTTVTFAWQVATTTGVTSIFASGLTGAFAPLSGISYTVD